MTKFSVITNRLSIAMCSTIREKAALCPSLQYLNTEDYMPGRKHWLIQHTREVREVTRLKTKLKLVTGSYVLQVNRTCFNQNQVNRTCMICNTDEETTEQFLLTCNALAETRRPMLARLVSVASYSQLKIVCRYSHI